MGYRFFFITGTLKGTEQAPSLEVVAEPPVSGTAYTGIAADGEVELTIGTAPLSGDWIRLYYRADGVGTTEGYYLYLLNTNELSIRERPANDVKFTDTIAFQAGDVIRITFSGGTHTVFYNGSEIGSFSDSTWNANTGAFYQHFNGATASKLRAILE